MFIIVSEGRNDTHDVDLQLCQPVPGMRKDYDLVDTPGYDIHEAFLSVARLGYKDGDVNEV